jgi:hypothetical protein
MAQERGPCKEHQHTVIRWRGRLHTRNARSSSGGSTSISINYTAGTRRSAGAHAPSGHKKPRTSGRWAKAEIFRKGVNISRAYRKKKPKVPISANPKNQYTRQGRPWSMKGGRKEYHHAGQGEQITLCMGWRKLRGWREGNGRAMLYPKGSQNAGTQRIQATTRLAKIRWVTRTQVMVVRLSSGSTNT